VLTTIWRIIVIRTAKCPETHRWQSLLANSDASDSAELELHLSSCSRCRTVLDDLAVGTSGWLRDASRLANHERDDPEMTKTLHRLLEGEHIDPPIPLDFLTPSDLPGILGTLGRYQVMEVIGRGAMGIVLKALDPDLLRPVAIKVLAPYLAPSGTARQRFLREARAAAAVSHDRVVTIHAVEPADGLPYLVMEYVTGVSLQGRLDRDGPLPPRDIARIGLQAANGLSAAHDQGLVHRDIKPANILLENGVERVKITDFGLARAADDARLTQSGVAAGTPLYMSPEQARGETVDSRSDLFSLGSVLYTLATGFPPFRAESTMGVLNRINHHSPRPIRETIPDFPPALEKIIMQLLEKDPGKRFQLGADVSFRLTAFLGSPKQETHEDVELAEPGEPTKRQGWWHVVLPVLAGIFVVAVVLMFRTPKGTLIVEVDDPGIKVALDGEDLKITGAGVEELRVKVGTYHVTATKDGKPATVSHEIITITKNGKQVVKVTYQPEIQVQNTGFRLQEQISAMFPEGTDRHPIMLIAYAKALPLNFEEIKNRPNWYTHPSYGKLKELMAMAGKNIDDSAALKKVLTEAHELAGKINDDTNAAHTATRKETKGPAKSDPEWSGKLNGLNARFTAIIKSMPQAPTNQQGPEFVDRVKKFQDLFTQYQDLSKRSRASAARLEDLKLVAAGSMRQSIKDQLEADYTQLLTLLKDIEKVAIELGGKPAPLAKIDPVKSFDDWEARQKKLVAEFVDLVDAIAKTPVGIYVKTIPPGSDYLKATAQMMDQNVADQIRRILITRDQFGQQKTKAEKDLERWEKAKLAFRNSELHYKAGTVPVFQFDEAKLELSQSERALRTTEESMTTLLADMKKLAAELGLPGTPEEEFKRIRDDYDALLVRLAKSKVGRALVVIKRGSWNDADLAEQNLPADKKELASRMLKLRDEFLRQWSKGDEAARDLALCASSRSPGNLRNAEIDARARKGEADLKISNETMRGLLEELNKLADTIDPPAKK